MEIKKRPTATVEADRPPRHHRYPTRWKFGRHAPHSSLSQDKAIVSVLAPCKRNFISQDKAIVTRLAPSKPNKRLKSTLYLPREIIFSILLFVPARVLRQVATYVCKQWNDIVKDPRFIKAHCLLSSAGLLFQNPKFPHQVYYIEGDDSTEIAFPFEALIHGSVNGLVLFHYLDNRQILFVINPLTNVKISLPPVHRLHKLLRSNIGFAITSSGHYKVVVTLADEGPCSKIQVMVFTLGIDKAWRFIDLQGNSEMEAMTYVRPRFIAGMLYWCIWSHPCFAMDVDTETIYHFPKPNDFVDGIAKGRFVSMGACLGLVQRDTSNWNDWNKWMLWKLTDVKSGKWTKLAGINITNALITVGKEFYPKTWQMCKPVMLIDNIFWFYYVFDRNYVIIRFNLANGSFVFFPVQVAYFVTPLFHHVRTLLSPNKCYF